MILYSRSVFASLFFSFYIIYPDIPNHKKTITRSPTLSHCRFFPLLLYYIWFGSRNQHLLIGYQHHISLTIKSAIVIFFLLIRTANASGWPTSLWFHGHSKSVYRFLLIFLLIYISSTYTGARRHYRGDQTTSSEHGCGWWFFSEFFANTSTLTEKKVTDVPANWWPDIRIMKGSSRWMRERRMPPQRCYRVFWRHPCRILWSCHYRVHWEHRHRIS